MFAKIVILAFIVMEFSNVLALYFAPGSKYANAVGVFSAWEKSKEDPEIHDFVRYLVYWVAGAKLIFLFLLGVITLFGSSDLQRMSLVALSLATLSFYWRLFPLIRKLDQNGQIKPKNYSIVIGGMISVFILFFAMAASVS
jgi:dolichol kinase